MLTVRSRAIELSAAGFGGELDLPADATPARLKLEADAHLAVCIDEITERLVTSDVHRQRFIDRFRDNIRKDYPLGTQNSRISPVKGATAFGTAFNAAYDDHRVTDMVMEGTPLGIATQAACDRYVALADKHVKDNKLAAEISPFRLLYSHYRNAPGIINLGMGTLSTETDKFVRALNLTGLSTEERARRLEGTATSLLRLASLSLYQNSLYTNGNLRRRNDPEVRADSLDMAPNIAAARSLPVNTMDFEAIRPHHGCPAMPSLPRTENLNGGSGIRKMWGLVCELVLDTNMHAIGDDRPGYEIVGYGQYQPEAQAHLEKKAQIG